MISISCVIYKNQIDSVNKLIACINAISIDVRFALIDNSPEPLKDRLNITSNVEYYFTGKNLGYGKGHNFFIEKIIDSSTYHIIVNPDIYFEEGTIEHIIRFLDLNENVGALMPNLLNTDGSIQYLGKLLPTPWHLTIRRFASRTPFYKYLKLIRSKDKDYELRNFAYAKPVKVPNLSGAFMALRIEAIKEVGLFDDQFFMYCEDVDLSRRINQKYKTVFYPHVCVYHEHQKGSYKNFRLLFHHICSAIKYFNKWGWVFDQERMKINNEILHKEYIPITEGVAYERHYSRGR